MGMDIGKNLPCMTQVEFGGLGGADLRISRVFRD